MSDIHIYPSGRIPEKFVKMVEHVVAKKPEIVFITGDHTNGNRGDSYDAERISFWYDQLDKALKPIFDAGIIVVPTVGNHDFYEVKHQEGYKNWATKTLRKYKETLNISLDNPLYFNFSYKSQEFYIMKLWTQKMDSEQREWFKSKSKKKPEFNRFAFGHVPLKSIRGKTAEHFYKTVGQLFSAGHIDIYFTGHEHMHWDEFLPFTNSSGELRQLTTGTTSGTYNHAIRRQARELHCMDNKVCTLPATSKQFYIERRDGRDGYQIHRQNFIEVVFLHLTEYEINSYALDNELRLINFYKY